MSERFSCARTSRDLREPILGTASTVVRWLLVEQAGPWGRNALPESRLGPELGDELTRRARKVGARPLLIRRPDGTEGDPRSAYVVSSRKGWAQRIRFADPEELLDLDLEPLGRDEPVDGERFEGPLLLTCTNGRHDACCAEWGRPVAAAVAVAAGEHAWEVSHIGGDRFAANILWLPAGVYYGRVEPDEAALVAALAATNRLSLPHYRGRSTQPFAVQAAEVLLRRELACDLLDDVRLVSFHRAGDRVRANFRQRDASWEVQLTVEPEQEPQRLTCRAPAPVAPARYRDVTIEPVTRRT